MARARHSDSELLALAAEGSASAFAALLHRHRRLLQEHATDAADPERAIEAAVVAAMRSLRRGTPEAAIGPWLARLVDEQVAQAPAPADVERIVPAGWFDQLWVRVHARWPHGRRIVRVPGWAKVSLAAASLVVVSAGGTYLMLTAEDASEIVLELSAVPLEGPGILTQGEAPPPAEPEEAPELFGDVEIGELPTYDLTGRGPQDGASG